jgi:xanthine dehydrogenase YagR molybdenum-binding subunit
MTSLKVSKSTKDGKTRLQLEEHEPEMAAWGADARLDVVGTRHPRLEAIEKVTGRAQYSSDVRLPRQLYAAVLRSPHPHARITAIDISAAAGMPGVYAVICAENTEPIAWYDGSFIFDRTVRLIGDEVAVVAAESEEIAQDALRQIAVTYESLPFVSTIEESKAPDAPKVREEGNVAGEPKVYTRGDPEATLRQAEVVIDRTYTTQAALHNSLEPHGCTASWDGETLTLWESTQSIFTVRQQVAEALGLPEHRVRVIKQHMGGGFGAKQISWKQDVIASLLAQKSGRPVQLMLDREAENLVVGNRPPSRQRVRLGATRDGTLTVIDAEIEQTIGAYMTGGEASDVSGMYQTLYRCANVRTVQTPLYTNANPGVAFRAPGHVEAAWALEQAMDELARGLDIDPIELRLRNYSEKEQLEDKPYTLPEGLRLSYDRVREAFGWDQRERSSGEGRVRRGVGFAAHDWVGGSGHPPGYAWIELNEDGSADVVTGTQDIGTGTRTGLPLESVSFHLGDTGVGPYAPVSSGSATQATIGPAVRAAAADVKAQLLQIASTAMEIPVNRLSVRQGNILVDGEASRSVTVKEIMQQVAPHTLHGQGVRGTNPKDKVARTFGAQIVELEVDTETGEITVLRVVTAHDCGRIVNPTMVDSQVIGGITQGIGFALTEERIIDPRLGLVLNPNLEEYKVPTIADVPPIDHAAVDVPDPDANPTGAKGIGEPPLVPTAPAIANAVYDAVGIRFYDAPLSRHRLLEHLAGQQEQNS